MMLSQGEFLNLYTIGYSVPEAYATRKGQAIYYAFFASGWEGGVDLRGLSPGVRYHLRDYENDRPLGEVTGPDARIMANFKDHLLIEAKP
jgi:alpha-galactosidase